ncbi:HU family DNA-binding protein [Aequorivita echinoideorum]|uniref:HU family DNA-binding protein n=1 Tax=Aequorivita echinoideorum TaxID=1549647 RepID=A0ABS5S444_9FLAO|nr:HU family DNA-binding protein [Aequorivita echinoideorum]MBT0607974.1 HU family DNA-binding protein [Aequorivita echinoideorum]
MPLKYKIVKRINPQNTSEEKYIMQHIATGVVDLERLCDEISKESSLSHSDIIGVVTALTRRMQDHLENGNIVDMGGLGRYKVGFKAKPLEQEKAPLKPHVEKFYINYQPSPKLKMWLKNGLKLTVAK